ncbi:hypothetical protein CIK06_25530 [Plantactinospora sp. KBS50]|nr:hypothetical protein CIK06_25530 [Plantactinospora sp. KBS50]
MAAAAALPVVAEVRVARTEQPLTEQWRRAPVRKRGSTRLGISFRPRQAEAMGLDLRESLDRLLEHPFEVIRLGAYWNRLEPEPGAFRPEELDWQVDAAERAGKQVIISVGAVKNFGYPEYFVPDHVLDSPLREGALVVPDAQGPLLAGATAVINRVVERYRDRGSVIAWQVEHEAVDPLGMEHSWRLATAFVRREVETVRIADPTRPVMLNGFLPTSLPVGAQQWWRTRDQGDSLAVAQLLADIVGIDFYPRHAVAGTRGRAVYLAGSRSPWQQRVRRSLFEWASLERSRAVMVSEGQAEPWETITDPPNPFAAAAYSCRPEHLIENYNQCMSWNDGAPTRLSAYLFWGAEYWLARERDGDPRYLAAFSRVLAES